MALQKNVASQKWIVFAWTIATNVALAGDAAQITGNLRLDGGGANAIDDTNPTELEDGFYAFDLSQAETNADNIVICPASSTSGVAVIGCPMACWTDSLVAYEALQVTNRAVVNNIHDTDLPAVPAAVWDLDATTHQTTGTFGQAIGDPVADTNTIFKAVVTDATGATVGVDVVAVKAELTDIHGTDLPAVKTDTAAILTDTGTTLDANITKILKVLTGKWEITNNQLIMYDTDGTTALYTFNLTQDGTATEFNPDKRTPA